MLQGEKSILVTGGAGFIGSHLCKALVKYEARVAVVDHFSTGRLENLQDISHNIDLFSLDFKSQAFSDLLTSSDFDVIFHFAGTASVPLSVDCPEDDFQSNLAGTFQLLETMRQSGSRSTLIVASSAAVYGNPSKIPISETDPTNPISPYGISKLAMERYVFVYSQLYGLKTASLRPFSVYGPRLSKQIVYDFIQKLTNNPDNLSIIGDGSQVRDFIYVDDIVHAALVVLNKAPLKGEVYNVASGHGYSTQEIAETLTKEMGIFPEYKYTGEIRPGEPDKWIACIDRLKALGFTPQVSLSEGLRRTLDWYKSCH